MEEAGEPPSNNANSNVIDDETTRCSVTQQSMEADEADANGEADLENNSLHQPLLKRNRTLSASHLAMVGAKVSYIESLDYEYIYSLFSYNLLNLVFLFKFNGLLTECVLWLLQDQ